MVCKQRSLIVTLYYKNIDSVVVEQEKFEFNFNIPQHSPKYSSRKHFPEIDLARTSFLQIFPKDLHFHSYKIQIFQAIKPADQPYF